MRIWVLEDHGRRTLKLKHAAEAAPTCTHEGYLLTVYGYVYGLYGLCTCRIWVYLWAVWVMYGLYGLYVIWVQPSGLIAAPTCTYAGYTRHHHIYTHCTPSSSHGARRTRLRHAWAHIGALFFMPHHSPHSPQENHYIITTIIHHHNYCAQR